MSKAYDENVIGPLRINIHSASLERDTEMVGEMDPYVKFYIGGAQVKETAKLDGAGKKPVWNEEISHNVTDMNVEVKFEVWDDDGRWSADDIVGSNTITMADLCRDSEVDNVQELKFEGKRAGEILFKTTFTNFAKAKAEMAAEIERLRQEEEAKAAAEAAEAEAAERARIEAEEAAERERLEAEEAERLAAEAAAKAEKERLEAEEAERIAREEAERAEKERLEAEEAERLA